MASSAFANGKKNVGKETDREPFDRGISRKSSCFIPKGTVGAGVSVSYNTYSLGNGLGDAGYSALFSLIQDVHGNGLQLRAAVHHRQLCGKQML